ncbi:flagellar hook-basal body protein [Paenibacillus glucanolyticus]|nr:flagellar hook-basal body protein [Paenibacillus sp. Cedars]AWP30705.1 flagellar basal body rod protein [Paenibacillus sp. Cedars]
MLRGLYTAASGMMTQEQRHNTVTQNIANVNTAGYKATNSVQRSFPEVLVSMIGGNDSSNAGRKLGKFNTGVYAEESISLYTEGALRESGKNTDFALVSSFTVQNPATGQDYPFDASGRYVDENGEVIYRPEGFFTVQDENGDTRYTRNGSFRVSPEGNLLSESGYQVLDNNNRPIILTGSASDFTVNEQGEIMDAAGNGTGIILGVSIVSQPHGLIREGNGVFRMSDPDGEVRFMTPADNGVVRQGFIEGSNVDPTQSMVELTAALRAYETNQKIVQYYDRTLEKAVNEIGRV